MIDILSFESISNSTKTKRTLFISHKTDIILRFFNDLQSFFSHFLHFHLEIDRSGPAAVPFDDPLLDEDFRQANEQLAEVN